MEVWLHALFTSVLLSFTSENAFGLNSVVEAIRVQAWTGPEGYSRLRLTYFKTVGK
jgi:hypothetical protein